MQKRKRWQQWLILLIIVLTIYNILPTVFYYSKSLKKSIDRKQSETIANRIMGRVNILEKESTEWLKSYCKMLKIKPSSIEVMKDNSEQVNIEFYKVEDANKFKKYFRRAGNLIPFVPAQLSISDSQLKVDAKKITVQRQVPIQFDTSRANDFFEFTSKFDDKKRITTFYKELTFDRAAQIGEAIAGVSENAILLQNITKDMSSPLSKNMVYTLVHNILDFTKVFGTNSPMTNRYFATFTQGNFKNPKNAVQTLISAIDNMRDELKIEKSKIQTAQNSSEFLSDDKRQQLYLLDKRQTALLSAESIIKNNLDKFSRSQTPLSYKNIFAALDDSFKTSSSNLIRYDLKSKNPFISQIIVDFANDKVYFTLHKDIIRFEDTLKSQKQDLFDQLIINEIATLSRRTDEKIMIEKDEFSINLHTLENTSSYLVLNLLEVAKISSKQLLSTIAEGWHPTHSDLSRDNFPIYDYATYQKLSEEQKRFCLVVYVPALQRSTPLGLHSNSIYVMANGLDKIIQKYKSHERTQEAQDFFKDFDKLQSILQQNGYLGFSGDLLAQSSEFKNSFVFEKDGYYQTLLKATRENFQVYGSKKYAVLEFSNLEQRILTLNKIETTIQEDLLKWKDDYNAAKISIDPSLRYDFPEPTKNALISNLLLSARKYFRGDERKVIHWGLDLSGGKTVQIELRDQNNHLVKDEAALKQGMNELYNRVNKMGVSEVNIRTIDSNIVLDFPGAQGLSAKELVKASSMSFQIINEKFTPNNLNLSEHVNKFLQEVYNEAIVTNKKDIQNINTIAYKHLYGKSLSSEELEPISESAKILYENGLRLAADGDGEISSAFNDTISKIALFKGDEASEWHNQTNPLVVVFKNYALEGTSLVNIRSVYDPSQGNFLTFEVRGSYTNKEGIKISPREEVYMWTSHFSKDNITGTPLESFSKGQGWRMAVILNDYVISAPTLKVDFKDSAQISGSFSLREVNQLAADLKAGSLSYTPHILSEKNVSPELGAKERLKGIIATFAALVLVIMAMVYYYRFAGVVASIAVLFNLLIMWATLQNLHATLTLAGIAGIILTVGMAVDANVLVFERIREEFAITKRISSAIQNGYKKAFSAIFDSNLTTIIAALILLNFDSGPIKGFALTLIIGIASSMFTALFVTRFFFTKWAQNPKNTVLNMLNFVKVKKFNFLKFSKYIFIVSGVVILIGGYTLAIQKKSVLGMDFTGGFALTVEIDKTKTTDYRVLVEKALVNEGVSSKDFTIRELTPSNHLRILFGTSMLQKGKPFHDMDIETDVLDKQYNYQTNPKIAWVVNALNKNNIEITNRSLEKLDQNWTLMSGQMSDAMRKNAIWGLGLALIAILIYITFRFEFKFAISAMICLIHDVVITLGIVSILHILRVPIQIDLHTVAALMTIIGYSLNDTIVIFDRIREDLKHVKKRSFSEIINHSLNLTLSRTTITSATTILALIALVILGGSTIFSFALVMTIGVIFGTLSSLFIASPLMLMFHNLEMKKSLTFKNQEK
ncbi:MAG: hypothetical protein K940chlam1_00757 [Candidatus Anoxychlamydiales bacterium]|nr:hypothetical protein [Candidatus Anoxychlamydiales bacterium]NGX35453.1 hypothetical protein [Candidatus Anoxychlamydiales bacterium]